MKPAPIGRVVLLAALATPVSLIGQPSRRSLTLEDYYRLATVTGPAISPDGRHVTLVRNVIDEAANQRRSEIWLAAGDGSAAPTRMTIPSINATNPVWSRDGKLLAFTSQRSVGQPTTDTAPIWFLSLERPGEAFQIPGVGGAPIFSPDNRWIAFTRAARPPPRAPQALSEPERKIRERFTGRAHEWIQYRFDGRGYLPDPTDSIADPPEELYIVARDGGAPRRLTTLGVDVQDPVWNPSSTALALTANTHQRDEYTYERADLWLVSLDGTTSRLTDDGYHHSSPAWSPDGKTLVFLRRKGLTLVIGAKESRGAPVDLYVMPAGGGGGGPMRNLTAEWDLIPEQPSWSGDGRFVYFMAEEGGDRHLFRTGVTGATVERITKGPRRLGGLTIAAAGDRIAYTATDPTHPAEAYAARLDGSGEVKLTSFNDSLVAAVDLVPAARLRYSSKDGTEIEGWLIQPRGSGPHPLILSIHGGPHGAYGNEFSFPFQLLAMQGYAVLYTNPRGSTGYGEQFLWATWGGWGILDAEDVLGGVDYVLTRFPIDRNRLGVSGYSYGGFLTNWVITHDRRFTAAVSGAGISNWVSDYATADIPRTKESEFFGPPWEERSGELLMKQSPVMHAKGVTTPTLFLHGEADYRVPLEQAEQMYLALRKQRVPARLVRYPNTSHGGWTPWNMVHRYHEEVRWFGRYLRREVP